MRINKNTKEVKELVALMKRIDNATTDFVSEGLYIALPKICENLIAKNKKLKYAEQGILIKTKKDLIQHYYSSIKFKVPGIIILPNAARDMKALNSLIENIKITYSVAEEATALVRIKMLVDTLILIYKDLGVNSENLSTFSRIFWAGKGGELNWIVNLVIGYQEKINETKLASEADKETEVIEKKMSADEFGMGDIQEMIDRMDKRAIEEKAIKITESIKLEQTKEVIKLRMVSHAKAKLKGKAEEPTLAFNDRMSLAKQRILDSRVS